MAEPVDSLSIELTASTGSAEASIQRVIDMLRMLKAATIDASIESKIGKSIRSIAQAAKEIDSDAGQKLARLAGGLRELSKVGDLSNLANAGKNLSGVVRAVNSMGHGGNGLSNLANGIRGVSDALGGIKDADVSKLNAVKDALSGEMSGSLHSSARASESAALGGMGSPEPSFGNMAAYGAMTVFKYTADSIRDATAAYHEFQAALGSGIPPIFTEFVNGAKEATRSVMLLGNAIRGLLTEGQNFSFGGAGDTFFKRRMAPLLNAGQDFTFGSSEIDKSNAIEIEDLGERAEEAAQGFRDLGDAEREAAQAFADIGNSASSAASVTETAFVNPTATSFSTLDNIFMGARIAITRIGDAFGSVGHAVSTAASGFVQFTGIAGFAKDILYGFGNDADTAGKKMGGLAKAVSDVGRAFRRYGIAAIPGYFGGQLAENVKKATKAFTGMFNSVVRIAKYRLIRTAIREITQGISEGTKHLYNWSKAANGEFAASMNQIATASQYLGNSFAAMVSPLIEVMSPAIDFIVDKVVDMFNIINQIFARLSGKTSYTAAKKVAAQWDDASKKASGSAKKAADEIKRTILGFDEINKLNDANTRSGGGGGGGGAGDTGAGMFETRMIEGEVSNFADSLRTAFEAGNWSDLGTLLGNKVNEIVDSIDFAGAGQKVGYAINGWFTTKYWTLDTINFTNIGSKIASFLNEAIGKIDFSVIGASMVQKMTIIGDLVIGFFTDFDWGQAATALSDFTKGLFDELTKWINKKDWKKAFKGIVDGLGTFINTIDYDGIADSFADFLKSAINAVSAIAVDMIIQPTLTGFTDIVKDIQNGNGVNWEKLGGWLKDAAFTTGLFFAAKGNFKAGLVALGIGLVIEPAINTIAAIVEDIQNGNGVNWGKIGETLRNLAFTTGLFLAAKGNFKAGLVALGVGLVIEPAINTIVDIVKDIRSGNGVNWEKVGEAVKDIAITTGMFLIASGHFPAGVVALGVGLMIEPTINKITDIVKDIKENGLTKNTVIDIIEGLLKAIGAGMFIIGVMTGNPAVAGIGILAVGLSLAVRPAINKITDIVKDIKENGLSKNTVIDIVEGLLKGIGAGMFIIGVMTGNPVVAGIGILAVGLSLAVRPAINKITDIVKDIKENGLSKNTVIDIVEGLLKGIGVGMFLIGTMTGNPVVAGIGMLAFGLSFAVRPTINKITDLVENIKENGLSDDTILTILGAAFTAIGGIMLGAGVLTGNPFGIVMGALVLTMGIALKPVIATVLDIGENIGKNGITWETLQNIIGSVFTGLGTALLFINPVLGAITIGIGLIFQFNLLDAIFGEGTSESIDTMLSKLGDSIKEWFRTLLNDLKKMLPEWLRNLLGTTIDEEPTIGLSGSAGSVNANPEIAAQAVVQSLKQNVMSPTDLLMKFLFPGASAEESNSMQVPVEFYGVAGNGFKSVGETIELNDLDASPVKTDLTNGVGLQSCGIYNKMNPITVMPVKTDLTNGAGLEFCGAHNKMNPVIADPVTIDSKGGIGLQLSGTNTYTLTGIEPTTVSVGLKKDGWTNISDFVGTAVTVLTSLGKNGWTSISAFVGTAVTVLTSLGKNGWTNIAAFVGTSVTVLTSLGKSGWTNIGSFVGTAVTVLTSLAKGNSGAQTAQDVYTIEDRRVTGRTQLAKGNSGAQTAQDVYTIEDRSVTGRAQLAKANSGAQSVSDVYSSAEKAVSGKVSLVKNGWSSISAFVGTSVTTVVSLSNSGSNWVSGVAQWITGNNKGETTVKVNLAAGSGGTWQLVPKALGGAFYGGSWHNIPQYAGGTTNAHGSLFLAGEAGPEVVGHVGGRTEVLNKSQLASAMFSAVRSAMSGISIDASFYGGGNADGEMNGETLSEMMEYMRADSDEMRKQNELLRQQNELLRQIREKDYSPEISTRSINKAQTRANRRAGITIVPVGT